MQSLRATWRIALMTVRRAGRAGLRPGASGAVLTPLIDPGVVGLRVGRDGQDAAVAVGGGSGCAPFRSCPFSARGPRRSRVEQPQPLDALIAQDVQPDHTGRAVIRVL